MNALDYTNPELREQYLLRNGIIECFITHEDRHDWRVYESGGHWCGFEAAQFTTRREAVAFAREWVHVTGLDYVGVM